MNFITVLKRHKNVLYLIFFNWSFFKYEWVILYYWILPKSFGFSSKLMKIKCKKMLSTLSKNRSKNWVKVQLIFWSNISLEEGYREWYSEKNIMLQKTLSWHRLDRLRVIIEGFNCTEGERQGGRKSSSTTFRQKSFDRQTAGRQT